MPIAQNKKLQVSTSGKSSVLSRIMSLEDLPEDGIKLLIYGHSGTGKTRLIGTFAEAGKLLHIICSSNKTNEARSIRGTKGVSIVELKDPSELSELVDYAKVNKFTTIALDHVTEFGNLVLAKILKIDKIPEQLSWGLAKQQEYQQMGLQVKEYLRVLLDFDKNVLIAGQERAYGAVEDDEGKPILPYISVATTPAVAGWLAPACDYIVQTYKSREVIREIKKIGTTEKEVLKKGPVKYYVRTGPSEVYTTKFRVSPGVVVPDSIVDPSYSKLKKLFSE